MARNYTLPSHIDAVAGQKNSADLGYVCGYLEGMRDAHIEKITRYAIAPTKEEYDVISFVEDKAIEIFSDYGGRSREPLLQGHIGVFSRGGISQIWKDTLIAGHVILSDILLVERCPLKCNFAVAVFHELAHRHSFMSLNVMHDENGDACGTTVRRSGLQLFNTEQNSRFLNEIAEGVIAALTLRFVMEKMSAHPLLHQEQEWLRKNGRTPWLSRYEELETVKKLADELSESKNVGLTKREAFAVLARAHLSGRILPFARLVEKARGRGSFKALAHETARKGGPKLD